MKAFHFPCDQTLDSSAWEYALMSHDRDRFPRFLEFRKRVLESFRNYMLPVIALKKQTSKEAVCLLSASDCASFRSRPTPSIKVVAVFLPASPTGHCRTRFSRSPSRRLRRAVWDRTERTSC